VLGLAISGLLYERFPDEPSGRLTLGRSQLTGNRVLAQIAEELGVPSAVRTNPRMDGLGSNLSVLADAVEALIGAVCLHGGFEAARAAVEIIYGERIASLSVDDLSKDPKTRLNELLQSRGMPTAEYTLAEGDGGPKSAACAVGDRILARSEGRNRAQAEQDAAAKALEELGGR